MGLLNMIGISLILVGWLVQAFRVTVKKSKYLNLDFVVIYFLGAAVIAVDMFRSNDMFSFSMNVIIGIVALITGIEAFLRIK
ncbi:MAG: hypothetical protein KJ696_04355 [Gammaproteobacteria bacterium]|nr:hypothetical protein [Gammaproteobacteria bacterium]